MLKQGDQICGPVMCPIDTGCDHVIVACIFPTHIHKDIIKVSTPLRALRILGFQQKMLEIHCELYLKTPDRMHRKYVMLPLR